VWPWRKTRALDPRTKGLGQAKDRTSVGRDPAPDRAPVNLGRGRTRAARDRPRVSIGHRRNIAPHPNIGRPRLPRDHRSGDTARPTTI